MKENDEQDVSVPTGENPLSCPAVEALLLFNSKWKPMLLHRLSESPARFGELKRLLAPISHKVLTEQLRELESDDLVEREISDTNVVTVTYSLTQLGRSLRPVLDSLYEWGQENLLPQNDVTQQKRKP